MTGQTVLLVEDHDDTRLAERFVLERCGYEVVEARTGFDGLALSLAAHPSVILLDMVLPGIDGEQLARMLRADGESRHIVLLAFSASDEPDMRARALRAGCDDFFAKPMSPVDLAAVVGRYLDDSA
jgi:two-component system cell cycle response regulator DivK